MSILLFIFITGLFFGSFLNVLADRLPHGRTILGRSHCDSCRHVLRWNDLIPVISFTVLHGKCRYCKASFSIQYPLSELFTAAIFTLTWILTNQWHINLIMSLLNLSIAGILIVMLLSDLRYQILPDEMQIALVIVGLIRLIYVTLTLGSGNVIEVFTTIGMHILYGGAIMAPLLLVFLLTRGRGMGFGDVKFAFSIGFILGILSGFGALYIGFISGGLVGGILLILKKGSLKSKIPFGPFLILGFYLMLFYEQDVIYWLSKLYGF